MPNSISGNSDMTTPEHETQQDNAQANPQNNVQNNAIDKWLDEVNFNADGLIPAIAKDKESGDILMMAWMNKEALKLTANTKTAVYYSRSRDRLWKKGETSGHTQIVHDIYLDCDADALILSITQVGNIACHTGRQSCFYRKLDLSSNQPSWQTIAPVIKDPDAIYGNQTATTLNNTASSAHIAVPNSQSASQSARQTASQLKLVDASSILSQLDRILVERKQADASSSYVASLYAKGINKILEKVGEEAVETVIAAKDLAAGVSDTADNTHENTYPAALMNDLVYEIADVWFHTLVTLAWFNVGSDLVLNELARRFGVSGIDEKNSRTNA